MKRLIIALLGLASCSTLDSLNQENPDSYRAVEVQYGLTRLRSSGVRQTEPTYGLSFAYRPHRDDTLTSELAFEKLDGIADCVHIGVRYPFNLNGEVQPSLGIGASGLFLHGSDDDVEGAIYGSARCDFKVSGPWSWGAGLRVWDSHAIDLAGRALTLGIKAAF